MATLYSILYWILLFGLLGVLIALFAATCSLMFLKHTGKAAYIQNFVQKVKPKPQQQQDTSTQQNAPIKEIVVNNDVETQSLSEIHPYHSISQVNVSQKNWEQPQTPKKMKNTSNKTRGSVEKAEKDANKKKALEKRKHRAEAQTNDKNKRKKDIIYNLKNQKPLNTVQEYEMKLRKHNATVKKLVNDDKKIDDDLKQKLKF